MTMPGNAVCAGLLLLLSSAAGAAEHSDPFEQMQNPKRLLRGALFTDAQMAQLRELRKAQWEQAKTRQTKEKAAWDEFGDKFTSTGAIDVAQLTALAKLGQQLRDQGEDENLATMFQMRAVLTADQLRHVFETHQKVKALNTQLDALDPTVAAEVP